MNTKDILDRLKNGFKVVLAWDSKTLVNIRYGIIFFILADLGLVYYYLGLHSLAMKLFYVVIVLLLIVVILERRKVNLEDIPEITKDNTQNKEKGG